MNKILNIETNKKNEFKSESAYAYSTIKSKYTITYAIKRGYFNLVRCLLGLGVDPNLVDKTEKNNYSSLIYCTFIKDEKWAENVAYNLLEYGADLKQTDSRKLTAIHYCCAFGRHNLLEIFLNSVDFDLSKSVDINGNSCMHYAIWGRNIKCVNLLIKKYILIYLTDSLNLSNLFDLRPTDIEIETSSNNLFVFNEINSLDECKNALKNFLKASNELKALKLKSKLKQDESNVNDVKKNKVYKVKKKSALSNKKENSSSNDQIVTTQIFQTQIDESEFQVNIKPRDTSSANASSKTRYISNTNFNHNFITKNVNKTASSDFIKEFSNDLKPRTETSKINSTLNKEESDYELDKSTAIRLTSRSFFISFKDFIQNYIEYKDIFYAKENMIKSALKKESSATIKKSLSFNINKNDDLILNDQKNQPVKTTDWKQELPNVFSTLENYMTTSFRESTRPPVTTKVKNIQKQYLDMKAQAKAIASTRKKKSKIIIVRNGLSSLNCNQTDNFNSASILSNHTNSLVLDEYILPVNQNLDNSYSDINLIKRKASK